MMEWYKNKSLENISEIIDDILYTEYWKDILGYEGLYRVSSFGRVKSLERWEKTRNRLRKESIIAQVLDRGGYPCVGLYKDGTQKVYKTHGLVSKSFIGLSELDVDHINSVKIDNRPKNLQYVTERENVHRHHAKKNRSCPVGVIFWKGKYQAHIYANNKQNFLGVFDNIEEASQIYQAALADIKNIEKYIKVRKVSPFGSGITKRKNTYVVRVSEQGKRITVGYYKSAEEAQKAKQEYYESK